MSRAAAYIVLSSLLVSAAALHAQLAPTKGTPVESKEIVIRTYDLSDLFRVPPNYPLPPDMIPATSLPGRWQPSGGLGAGGGGGQGMFGGAYAPGHPGMQSMEGRTAGVVAQPVTAESVAQLVMSTVAPESWREAGGAIGSLRFIGNRLVVSQTVENQKQVAELLNGIREEGGLGQMVRVQAYWVQLTPEDLRTIAGNGGDPSAATLKEVPDDMVTDDKVYASGQTLGYSGQTVHVASVRANTVITGIQPVVGAQSVGYQLETASVQSGVALQVTPQALSDGQVISLDLHSIVSEVTGTATMPDPRDIGAGRPTTAPVEQILGQRPRIAAQQFSTTARVPVGKRVLIGGMTFAPTAEGAGEGDGTGAKQLYLVVEANAIK